MSLRLRAGTPADAEVCGMICYEAFAHIAQRHGFPPDFPSAKVAVGLLSALFENPDIYSVVAELNQQPVGSNFLWKNGRMAGVGPVTVSPDVQDSSVGRSLMEDVLAHAADAQCAGVRLVQAGYHLRSLALYTKLGFDVQEPLANIQGHALEINLAGFPVRNAHLADLPACDRLCFKLHGFARSRELQHAIEQGTAMVVEHEGRVVGYATQIGFFGHATAEHNDALKALIGAAPSFAGPGFLLPMRNTELMRWCLQQGLRVVQPMTLMSLGLYNQPRGVFLPSILY